MLSILVAGALVGMLRATGKTMKQAVAVKRVQEAHAKLPPGRGFMVHNRAIVLSPQAFEALRASGALQVLEEGEQLAEDINLTQGLPGMPDMNIRK